MNEPAREGSSPRGADGKAAARNGGPGDESIDRIPLVGCTRRAFEKKLHAKNRLKKHTWHLLDTLLTQYHWGKADSFPSIRGLLEWLPGWSESTIRRHLHLLSEAGVIRMFEDRSIANQRRIVLVDHLHAAVVIKILTASPNVREMAPRVHLGVSKMHASRGVKKSAPRGVKKSAPRGVRALTPEPLTVEPEKLNQTNGNSRDGEPPASVDSPPVEESSLSLGTVNGKTGGALAPLAQEVAPLPTAPLEKRTSESVFAPVHALAMQALAGGTIHAMPGEAPAPEVDGLDVPAPSPPTAQHGAFDSQRWSFEQRRRIAAGEPVFQSQDEMEVVRQFSSLNPGSTDAEVVRVAYAVAILLNDRHSMKNWRNIGNLVRLKKIRLNAFIGIAGTANPGAVVMHRLQSTIEAAKAERQACKERHSRRKGIRP